MRRASSCAGTEFRQASVFGRCAIGIGDRSVVVWRYIECHCAIAIYFSGPCADSLFLRQKCAPKVKMSNVADASFRNLDSSRFGTWIRLVSDPGFVLFRNAGEMVSRG